MNQQRGFKGFNTHSLLSIFISDLSTKNMIQHLRDTYRIGKDGAIEAALEQGQFLLEMAFGKTRAQIVFNRDITTPVF